MSNTDYRVVIKFLTLKSLTATQITNELADVYSHSDPSNHAIAKWVIEFQDPIRAFEDAPQSDRSTTELTEESIRTVHER